MFAMKPQIVPQARRFLEVDGCDAIIAVTQKGCIAVTRFTVWGRKRLGNELRLILK